MAPAGVRHVEVMDLSSLSDLIPEEPPPQLDLPRWLAWSRTERLERRRAALERNIQRWRLAVTASWLLLAAVLVWALHVGSFS